MLPLKSSRSFITHVLLLLSGHVFHRVTAASHPDIFQPGSCLTYAVQFLSMAISPEQVAYQRAHIHESKTSGLIGSTAALTAVATVLVFARFVARRHAKLGLKADDYLILLALVSTSPHAIVNGTEWLSMVCVADPQLGSVRGDLHV